MNTTQTLKPRMSTEEALQVMRGLSTSGDQPVADMEFVLGGFTGHTIGIHLAGGDRYKGQILAVNGGMVLFQQEYQSTHDGSVTRYGYLFPLASIHSISLNPQWEAEYTAEETTQ